MTALNVLCFPRVLRRCIGPLLALCATVVPSVANAVTALDLNITLSEKAEERLRSKDEGITALVSFYGAPKPSAAQHGNAIGMINLGSETLEITSPPWSAQITGEAVEDERSNWISGPVNVNINLFSSRQSSPDNVLNCDFIDGEFALAADAQISLHCSLIDEGLEVDSYP